MVVAGGDGLTRDGEGAALGERIEVMGEVVHVGHGQLQAAQEEVVDQHRWHRDGDPDPGGNQRMADGACHRFQAGRTGETDTLQRLHDPPDRTEQADERCGAADTGQNRLAVFQCPAFFLNLLAQIAFQAVGTVDGVGQLLGGTRCVFDRHRFKAAVGDTGQCARILGSVFGCRQQVWGTPESLGELFVLGFLPHVLRRLDQQQGPAQYGKQNECPEHGRDNHGRKRCVHGLHLTSLNKVVGCYPPDHSGSLKSMVCVAKPSIGVSPRLAGMNFQLRTASTAASSRTGLPLDWVTSTLPARPLARTLMRRITRPSQLRRNARPGYSGGGLPRLASPETAALSLTGAAGAGGAGEGVGGAGVLGALGAGGVGGAGGLGFCTGSGFLTGLGFSTFGFSTGLGGGLTASGSSTGFSGSGSGGGGGGAGGGGSGGGACGVGGVGLVSSIVISGTWGATSGSSALAVCMYHQTAP
ncbi:hypothetical protein ALQ47_05266 [Pseudomonas cichorii]|nr:hypothetical protein ALQ47_05266 [Pseudomonas cichorii]